jgi:hypothetical protein
LPNDYNYPIGKRDTQENITTYVKYARTYHVPHSPGTQSDDRLLKSLDHLLGQPVVITEKMDGENTSMYTDHIHARSLDSAHHESRNWVKKFHGSIAHDIPPGWRVCGENMYAKHSIYYEDLKSYFYGFSIWSDNNICLGWTATCMFFELLGIEPVPVLFEGILTLDVLADIEAKLDLTKQEGYVIRKSGEFRYEDFATSVAKWVRPKHVATSKHWMQETIVPNKLKDES